jgi:hypothetical protein
MKRGIVFAVLGLAALAGGCGTPARYVQKNADGGVVAIPANTNSWPGYNRREAEALIVKHVGPNFEIVEERQVVTGQRTTNEQRTDVEKTQNKRNPNLPGERQTTTGSVTTSDITEYQLVYRKVPGPVPAQPYGPISPAGGTQPALQGLPMGYSSTGRP